MNWNTGMVQARMERLPRPGLYTVAEAAYVSDVDTKAVDREIDAQVVLPTTRAHRAGRLLEKPSLIYLAALRDIRTAIDASARRLISQRVTDAVAHHKTSVTFGGFQLPINRLSRMLKPRLSAIDALRHAIEIKPGVGGGEPVLKGSRLKVRMLADLVRRGVPLAEIAGEYEVPKDLVELATLYDSLYPRRGRPSTTKYGVRKHGRLSE
jgi:uncharacterized protein (DUF433 family)